MTSPAPGADPGAAGATLSIGELAERTGVAPATIRMWEQRHGFPVPRRLGSGHRRYSEDDVVAVLDVARRREAGLRLDVAIARAFAGAAPAETAGASVYATLRRRHPHLESHRLRKSTLIALSFAIEDEFCARADRAHVFAGFQSTRFWLPSRARWTELDRVSGSTFVFADFSPEEVAAATGPVLVPLAPDAPMRREWLVVCDDRDLPAALTAWELPGQDDVPDRERLFESMWTVAPDAVRDAARVCARAAADAGVDAAAPLLYTLAEEPDVRPADLRAVTALFNRVVAYVDAHGA